MGQRADIEQKTPPLERIFWSDARNPGQGRERTIGNQGRVEGPTTATSGPAPSPVQGPAGRERSKAIMQIQLRDKGRRTHMGTKRRPLSLKCTLKKPRTQSQDGPAEVRSAKRDTMWHTDMISTDATPSVPCMIRRIVGHVHKGITAQPSVSLGGTMGCRTASRAGGIEPPTTLFETAPGRTIDCACRSVVMCYRNRISSRTQRWLPS